MNLRPPSMTLACANLFLLTVLLLDSSASAQSQVFPKWTARFDARKQNDAPVAMTTDASGNVFVTGSACIGVNCSDQEAVTIKYDCQGNALWKAWLSSPTGSATGIDLGVDSFGNVYVLYAFAFPEVITAKYNSAGVRQWINFIASDSFPGGLLRFPVHLAVAPEGNVYVIYDEQESASVGKAITLKYDTNGKAVWSRFVNDDAGNFAQAIGLDAHENIYVDVDVSSNNIEFAGGEIVKYDPNGNHIATFGSDKIGAFNAFHVDSAGASYFAGFAPPPGLNEPDRIVAKFNPDGTLAFSVDLNTLAPDPNRTLAAIRSDHAGNTFVAQTITDPAAASGLDISVIKFDTSGNQKYVTHFNGHADGSGMDQAVALTVNSFSEAYVTGQSAGVTGHPEFATIKYDSLGNRQWVERYVGPGESSDIPVAVAITGGSLIVTGTSVGSGTAQDWATINYVQDAASVSPSSLSFGSETLKTQSAAKTVKLTNTAEIPLASISVSVTGDFHVINNCPSSLAAHASCSLGVTFTPTELGSRTGTLTVHDNWAGNAIDPQTVALSGTGTP